MSTPYGSELSEESVRASLVDEISLKVSERQPDDTELLSSKLDKLNRVKQNTIHRFIVIRYIYICIFGSNRLILAVVSFSHFNNVAECSSTARHDTNILNSIRMRAMSDVSFTSQDDFMRFYWSSVEAPSDSLKTCK